MANKLIKFKEIDAYYLNLDSDEEKRFSTENALTTLGFKNIFRIPSVYDKKHKRIGIAKSFITALQTAKAQSKLPFAIFEDDISIQNIQRDFKLPNDADALYLGISPWGNVPLKSVGVYNSISAMKVNKNLYRIFNMHGAHAIIYLSETYVNFLISAIEKAIDYQCHQDIIRAQSQKFFNIYAVNDPVVFQSNVVETKLNLSDLNLIDPKGFAFMNSYTFESWDSTV